MNNETSNDMAALEAEVRDTVEGGSNVQERVRQLTLRVISARSLDIESVRQTAVAVLRGAQAAVQEELQHTSAQNHIARDHLKQAVSGLDIALAQFAEAAKLTVQEAAGRAQKYSSEDLKRARSDLGNLEKMFLETLQSSASATKNAAGEILHDLAGHVRTNGSAVGAQLKDTLSVLARHIGAAGRVQVGAGLHLAKNTADILRQIAAGVLTGLAEHVMPAQTKDKAE
jgi:phosphohistidine swiveling domain-containing protein